MRRTTIPLTRAVKVAALTLAVSGALTVAGCGVGVEDEAREIEAAYGTSAVSTPTPAATQTGPVVELIYLVRGVKLVPVERRVPFQPGVKELLEDLAAGPTKDESAAGLTSALVGSNLIVGHSVSNGLATIELASDTTADAGTGRTDQILQLGQIVCTLTSRPEITWVQFTFKGKPFSVPNGEAALVDGPFTAADYANVISTEPSPTPTA